MILAPETTNRPSEEEVEDDLLNREFNRKLDRYLCTGQFDEEDYYYLTPRQRDVIQTIKRAIKRIIKQ